MEKEESVSGEGRRRCREEERGVGKRTRAVV